MKNTNFIGNCLGCLFFIGSILLIIIVLRSVVKTSDAYSEGVGGILGIGMEFPSKIMNYRGDKRMKVCKRPYYSDSECYYTSVRSDGDRFTAILFNNNGYVTINDVECFELASLYGNTGDNRFFCNAYDKNDDVWDISLVTSNGDF